MVDLKHCASLRLVLSPTRRLRAWIVGVFTVIAVAAHARAGTVVAAEASAPGPLDFFNVTQIATVEPDNDNSWNPMPNHVTCAAGLLTPAAIDLVFTVDNEPGGFPVTEYEIEESFDNATTQTWIGFRHQLGFGTGDDFVLAPVGLGLDFDMPNIDPTPASDVFDLYTHWSQAIDWWGGYTSIVPPGEQVTFHIYVDVSNSYLIPDEFRTPDGYTFTVRQFPNVPPPPTPAGWYRGNTHTHSDLSFDGNDPPADVAAFYGAIGYDFLVLTDHHGWTDFSVFSTPDFLCISGEEITHATNHTNGLATTSSITPGTIAENVAAVLAQGALPQLNHPAQKLGPADVLAVEDLTHMEIYNAFYCCPKLYTDEWDEILSAGKLVYGVASDDSHLLSGHAGKAWIVVRSESFDEAGIIGAIEVGDFYASTGITLNDYSADDRGICVDSINGGRVTFIGHNGAVLQQAMTGTAEYVFQGSELYIRAEVKNSHEQYAWTQPVFPADTAPCPWDCDSSNDGIVSVTDLLAVLAQYDTTNPPCDGGGACDFDGNGCVDVSDLLKLLAHYDPAGAGCP